MCCVSSSCTSVSLPADMCVWCYARHVMGREPGRVVRGGASSERTTERT